MSTIKVRAAPLLIGLDKVINELIAWVQTSVVQIRNESRGIGAGVIWRRDGLILTNDHVVAGEHQRLPLLLADGRTFQAQLIARNPTLDLACLQLEAGVEHNLTVARIGDSARLRVGELVFAVGHPWGQRGIVTAGIVSGWGALALPNTAETSPYILSDVLLGPGNSGGPLVNAEGDVVGINAMIHGGDLSVAIPTQVVSRWLATLEQVV